MDRLKKIITAVGLILLCPNTNAQGVNGDSYVIAGDVLNPGVVDFESGSPVTVQALVEQGSPVHQAGQVFVLRGEPKQAETVDELASVQQNVLMPGDVVVFKSAIPTQMEQHHVVLIQGGAATILSYPAFSSFSFRSLAKKSPEMASLEQGFVDVNRPATSSAGSIAVEETMMHGDVIELPLPQNIPAIAYSSPETRAEADSTIEPQVSQAMPEIVAPVRSVSSSDFSLSIPGQAAGASEPSTEDNGDSLTPSILDGDPFIDLEADGADNGVQVASLDSTNGEASYADPQAETNEASDSETNLSETETEEAGIWNGLFLLGMIFAMGLILVGWVKTQQDREDERQRQASMKDSISGATREPAPQPILQPEAMIEQPLESIAATAVDDSLLAESDADTIQSIIPEDSTAEDCPVLSAGLADLSLDASSGGTHGSDSQEPGSFDSNDNDGPGPDNDELPVEPVFNQRETYSDAIASLPQASTQEPKSELEVEDTEIDWERANGTKVTSHNELDELLENRLPMELQQAELPLRVALYGKPAGPRKIRIDAAHTQIAAPHMARRPAEARKAEPVLAAAKSKQKTSQQAAESRFDNALNKLSRQEES